MKNKKIIVIIIALLIAILLTGCNTPTVDMSDSQGRMTLIYNNGFCTIYRDNETGVQYFSEDNGGTCVMVDTEGKPYISNK